MLRIRYSYLFFLACAILFRCTDDPRVIVVHTGLVKEITEQGVLFAGSIQGSGTQEILEYGFVWSTRSKPSLLESRFKAGEGSFQGEFERQVRSDLATGVEYNVWAYVVSTTGAVFGEAVSFRSDGVEGPVITGFSPASGTSGDVITITGANFSQQPKTNVVKVGTLVCAVISSADTLIEAALPSGINISGKFRISVSIGNDTGLSADEFKLLGPILGDVNPRAGIQGTLVTIDGEGFSSVPAENIVRFGQTVSSVLTATPTQLVVRVPPTDAAGIVALTVTVKGSTGEFGVFTIEGPEIIAISTAQEYPGRTMVITGKNFSPVISENAVSIGFWPARVLEATTTELKVEIPFVMSVSPGIPSDVKVVVTQKTFSKPKAFTARTPWTDVAGFPGTARTHAASFVIGNKGYLGTGTSSAICACQISDFWSYDTQSNTWERKADFPGLKRYYALGFSVGGKGYIVGGQTQTAGTSGELWEYNAALNQWTRKNDPGFLANSIYDQVVTANDRAYVLDGQLLYEYDPGQDQWISRADFPTWASSPIQKIAFGVGDKIYVSGHSSQHFYSYDPQLNTWTKRADTPMPAGGHSFVSFSVNGKGYVGSGRYLGGNHAGNAFYRYDPVADKWEQIPSTHLSTQNAAIFVVNGFAYYGSGNYGDYVQNRFVKFNPVF